MKNRFGRIASGFALALLSGGGFGGAGACLFSAWKKWANVQVLEAAMVGTMGIASLIASCVIAYSAVKAFKGEG